MFKNIIILITLLISTSAFAQDSLFDVKLGGGGGGGPGPSKVTIEQLVDGALSWGNHGCKPRYTEPSQGILILECPWFPQTANYKLTKGAIPPDPIVVFPSDPVMLKLSLAVGKLGWPGLDTQSGKDKADPRKELKAEVAKILQELDEKAEEWKVQKKKGKAGKKDPKKKEKPSGDDDDDDDSGDDDAPDGEAEELLSRRSLSSNGLQWSLCQWASSPKANESRVNPRFDPEKPMTCLVRVAFSFEDTKNKRKPQMSIRLARLKDIPSQTGRVVTEDGKLIDVSTLPAHVAFLMKEYGVKFRDAFRYSTEYPVVFNSPVLREGLIDTYQQLDSSGQPVVEGLGGTTNGFRVFYWIIAVLSLLLIPVFLFTTMKWWVEKLWNIGAWGTKLKALCGLILLVMLVTAVTWPVLMWVYFMGTAMLFIATQFISNRRVPTANPPAPQPPAPPPPPPDLINFHPQ